MINFRLPIDGLYSTVIRPVAIEVIKDIKELLYVNPAIRAKLSNQIDDFITNEQWSPIKLESNSPKDEIIHFSIEEETNEDTLITTALAYNDYSPILYDSDVKAMVRPIYVDTTISFNIKYRSRSKVDVNNLLNALKLNIADNEGTTLHNISYMFYVKPELLELFLDIAILKDKVEPTNEGFEDYLIKHTDGRMTVVGGLDGNTATMDFGIKEKQLSVNGFFETDMVSIKPEYGQDTGMWEAQLSYKLKFNKPTAFYVSYPPLIYNQLLPKKYLLIQDGSLTSTKPDPIRTATGEADTPFLESMRLKESFENSISPVGNIINIPSFDDYKFEVPNPHYSNVFSVLVSITEDDKKSLFKLDELPDYSINSLFLDFIKRSEYQYMTSMYHSMFILQLVDDNGSLVNGILTIDESLNVSSTVDLDMRRTYRCVFSIVTDIVVLVEPAINRMLNEPLIFNEALTALEVDGYKDNLTKNAKISLYNKPSKNIRFTALVNRILAISK